MRNEFGARCGGLAAAIALAVVLGGCSASNYLGTTKASYVPGGLVSYESNKNNEGFHGTATFDTDGKLKSFDIQTTATTPESAIAAVAAAQAGMMRAFTELMQMLGPLLKTWAAAATKGAVP